LQALKFEVQFAISRDVVMTEQIDGIDKLTLTRGIPVCSRSVVVASERSSGLVRSTRT
jgi:thioredoxin reductase (NADPH)